MKVTVTRRIAQAEIDNFCNDGGLLWCNQLLKNNVKNLSGNESQELVDAFVSRIGVAFPFYSSLALLIYVIP